MIIAVKTKVNGPRSGFILRRRLADFILSEAGLFQHFANFVSTLKMMLFTGCLLPLGPGGMRLIQTNHTGSYARPDGLHRIRWRRRRNLRAATRNQRHHYRDEDEEVGEAADHLMDLNWQFRMLKNRVDGQIRHEAGWRGLSMSRPALLQRWLWRARRPAPGGGRAGCARGAFRQSAPSRRK